MQEYHNSDPMTEANNGPEGSEEHASTTSEDMKMRGTKENRSISKDSDSATKFIHWVKIAMAQYDRKHLSECIRRGLLAKAERGIYPSRAPVGYKNVQDGAQRVLRPDPKTAPYVQQLFQWYASGRYDLRQLCTKAHAEGFVLRKDDTKISLRVVQALLRNPVYCGEFRWKGNVYCGTYEPLVSRDVFDQVQAVMRERCLRRPSRRHSTRPEKND